MKHSYKDQTKSKSYSLFSIPPKGRMISMSYYDTRDLKGGNFLMVPKGFFVNMSLQQAVFVSYLANMICFSASKNKIHEEGWIKCSSKFLIDRLNLTVSQERSLMKSVVDIGIVERKMMKNPARRYIRLDVKTFQKFQNKLPKKKSRLVKIR